MRKLKNRKHLTIAAILLMLTFLVGAAFALTPGAIQAVGVIGASADVLRVEWTAATPVANTSVASVNQAAIGTGLNMGLSASTPPYFNQPRMGPWTANHRLEWALGFIDDGTVTLNATATNTGTVDARVYAPGSGPLTPPNPAGGTFPITGAGGVTWNFDGTPSDFVTVTVSNPTGGTAGATAWPAVLAPGETVTLTITVVMDDFDDLLTLLGLAPLGFGWAVQGGWPDPDETVTDSPFYDGGVLEGFEWYDSFVFSLTYVAD